MTDVATLLQWCMDLSASDNGLTADHVKEALKCFQVRPNTHYPRLLTLTIKSWVVYAQRASVEKALELESLQFLTPLAIQALQYERLYETAAEMLSDALSNFSKIFTASDYELLTAVLCGPEAQSVITEMTTGDLNGRAVAFTGLILAYGDAFVRHLVLRDDPRLVQILQQLMTLLKHKGYPGADDDEICGKALDFWVIYVEFVSDQMFSLKPGQKPSWMYLAQQRILEVVAACWVKIRQPTSEESSEWDSDMRNGFQSFRIDVSFCFSSSSVPRRAMTPVRDRLFFHCWQCLRTILPKYVPISSIDRTKATTDSQRTQVQDMLQTCFSLLGLDIFEEFGRLAVESLDNQAWYRLEAALFCLNTLSEAVDDAVDNTLVTLFASPLFAELATNEDNYDVPTKTKQAAVTMISKYIGFFERHNRE